MIVRSKIGFHIAANCGGCQGISEMWRKLDDADIPFAVYSANDAGVIAQASEYPNATLVYRDVEASTVDPAHHGMDAAAAAKVYWQRTKERMPAEIHALKDRVWIELLNEPSRADARFIGGLMVEMAQLAVAEGWRVMGPGWSSGEPEEEDWLLDTWKVYLRLCAANPNRVALSLHEYSYDNDIHRWEWYLIGRFRYVHDACDRLGIAYPRIFVTECGWTLNSMPGDAQAKIDIDWLAKLYAESGIECAMLWTLQSGKGNGDLPERLNALIPWLTDYTLNTELEGPVEIDVPPVADEDEGVPVTDNLFRNGSFEGEWHDASNFPGHIPDHWDARYNSGDAYPNPYGQPYKQGEAVKKHRGHLPAGEPEQFIFDGDWTYKIFGGGNKAFWFQMSQTIPNLPSGLYQVEIPVFVDHYHWRDRKDFDVDPNQAQYKIVVNGQDTNDGWTSLQSGMKWVCMRAFNFTGGDMTVEIHLRSNWDINGNFWLDDVALYQVTDDEEEVPLPEDETLPEKLWQEGMDLAPLNFDAALQKKAMADGYRPLGRERWVAYEGVNYAIQPAIQWSTLDRRVYYARVPEWDKVQWIGDPDAEFVMQQYPVKQSPRVTQAFGARPEAYATWGFPGHEGIDLQASLGTPIIAAADGVISAVEDKGNYGKHIYIDHPNDWRTLYAHLDGFGAYAVGDSVRAGDTIGYAGSTGNSTGVHLHFGLRNRTRNYTDGKGNRWPNGIHDPTPYLKLWLNAPPVEPEQPAGLDLLPYFYNSGPIYQMTVLWQGQQHSQQMQIQGDVTHFYQVKNQQWEEFYADANFIYRGIDTSPGDNLYYWQRQTESGAYARWCPRRWSVGSLYERNPLVTFYEKNTGRQVEEPASGYRRTYLKFVAQHKKWRAKQGLEFSDVIELHWLPNLSGAPAEVYFYAKGFGLVGWSSSNGDYSFVSEVFRPGERSPAERERIVMPRN
jgi:murein DD-endopeptidase MepM/ murein hydrolase activator NlpD